MCLQVIDKPPPAVAPPHDPPVVEPPPKKEMPTNSYTPSAASTVPSQPPVTQPDVPENIPPHMDDQAHDPVHLVGGATKVLVKMADAVMNGQAHDQTFEKVNRLGQGGFGVVWLCKATGSRVWCPSRPACLFRFCLLPNTHMHFAQRARTAVASRLMLLAKTLGTSDIRRPTPGRHPTSPAPAPGNPDPASSVHSTSPLRHPPHPHVPAEAVCCGYWIQRTGKPVLHIPSAPGAAC